MSVATTSLTLAQDDDGGGGGGGGGGGFRPSGGNTGPEFISDSGPKLTTRFAAVYPYELALAGTSGEVELKFDVDVAGVPRNITVVSASDPQFVPAAVAAVEASRYKPALKRNRAVASENERRTIKFNPRSRDVGFDDTARKLVAELKKPEPNIIKATELDQPVAVRKAPEQNYPYGAMAAGLAEGSAQVECIIDPDGIPRLPQIVNATHEAFGWAAAAAILRVEFAPPRKDGKPVFTRVRIPFNYKLTPKQAPEGGSAPAERPRGERGSRDTRRDAGDR